MPYELLVDEVVRPLDDARYLLSPGDLYALRQMPEIIPLGIHADSVEVTDKGVTAKYLTRDATMPPGRSGAGGDPCFAGLP